jgi:hypothetical protein
VWQDLSRWHEPRRPLPISAIFADPPIFGERSGRNLRFPKRRFFNPFAKGVVEMSAALGKWMP